MKYKMIISILITMIIIVSIFGNRVIENVVSENEEENMFTVASTIVNQDLSTDSIRIETESPPHISIDIEANEVYLSSQPGDVNKEHVVTNPQAGEEVYIHWVFTIWGSGTVNPFYCRIWLRTQSGYDVIDVEVLIEDPQAGYIYTYWFTNAWTAPGGDFILSEEVDIYDDVSEDDENNNYASLSFTVTPTDLNFDFEAEDVWLSSEPYDWDKDHELNSPLDSGTEVFFYFHWIIWGVPETVTDPYYFKMTLTGPDGFEYEELIDDIDSRKAGYNIKVFLSDEYGNGWFAVTGSYTLTCEIDNQNDVTEWDENNNIISTQFTVETGGNQPPTVDITYPADGQTVSGTITITGTADDPDGTVTLVEVKIDNDNWQTASGTTSWSKSWDTNTVSDGQHTISARSYDGEAYGYDSVTVNVNNNPESFSIIHITDPHIGATGATERMGDVLEHINNLNPKPEMIIISGDLVDLGCFYLSPVYTFFGVFVPPYWPDIGKMNYMDFISLIDDKLDDSIKIDVCPGNHDYRYGDCDYLFWHPYYQTFDPTWWPPGLFDWHLGYSLQNYHDYISQDTNYETEYKNTLLVSLDSGHDTYDPSWNTFRDIMDFITYGTYPEDGLFGTGLSSGQISDLDTWLGSSSKDNKIVFMHHPAVNNGRTISNNKDEFYDICDDNNVEVVLTGHTHGNAVYDKKGTNWEPLFPHTPLFCNQTYYVQTGDCGQDSTTFRKIEVNGDDVFIYRFENVYKLANLYVSGPANIHIYDKEGNHVGLDENSEPESKIHGATYGHLDTGEEFVSVYYGEDDYRFEIHGIGEGTISLNLKIILKDGNTTEINYENIQVTDQTKATIYVHKDSVDQTLYIEHDSDKNVDYKFKPLPSMKNYIMD